MKKEINQKIRYHSWWWGRWIMWDGRRWVDDSGNFYGEKTFASHFGILDDGGWESYEEEKHGKHNALDGKADAVP